MLHEDDDPLSSSMFDTATSNSLLGNTMTTSMFSSQYEQDPWGNHSHAVVESPNDINRSYTTPNLDYNSNFSSNNDQVALFNSTTVLCKYFIFAFVVILMSIYIAGIRLPNMYEQLFSTSQRSGRVSLSSLNNILSKGKISANHIEMVSLFLFISYSILTQRHLRIYRLCKLWYQMARLM
jgi:hypothetical protein